jgi:hypothetical protein
LIRPAWQAKDLITRVKRLVNVDPSSACQRLFNATIHDLREKVIIAGIDIARDAAKQNKLPPVEKAEDIEEYLSKTGKQQEAVEALIRMTRNQKSVSPFFCSIGTTTTWCRPMSGKRSGRKRTARMTHYLGRSR